ncbi:MAG: OmpA family protein, partial [Elusimicrobia bacterium]|nr:OmpA family protein [Elusimicrobiota bacterium]
VSKRAPSGGKNYRAPQAPSAHKKAAAGGEKAQPSPAVPKAESPAASAPEGASEGAVSYKISFDANTANITAEGQRQLSYVADAMTYYPQESLKMIGFAGAHESDAQAVADRRARQVLSVLVEKYGIDSRRIQIQTRVLEAARPEVAIYSYVRQ